MQYFATVIPDSEEVRAEQILWLAKDKIEDQVSHNDLLRYHFIGINLGSSFMVLVWFATSKHVIYESNFWLLTNNIKIHLPQFVGKFKN
jgi:hypothetical protein